MVTLSETWELICICFGLFVNAVGLLYNVIRCVRAGGLHRVAEWEEMLAVLRRYECEAERLGILDGEGKLEYVLAKMRDYTEALGEKYEREAFAQAVEKDIAFANEMNAIKSERLE